MEDTGNGMTGVFSGIFWDDWGTTRRTGEEDSIRRGDDTDDVGLEGTGIPTFRLSSTRVRLTTSPEAGARDDGDGRRGSSAGDGVVCRLTVSWVTAPLSLPFDSKDST